jgi:flagellum-specific peptidoglycan hydrolase FlgJ
MVDSPFVWGGNGAQMTPEAIAAQRKVAQAMMAQAGDYSPVKSAWQGAARMAQGLVGGWEAGQADRAERSNASSERDLLASFVPGGATPAAAAPATPAVADAAPSSVATPMGAAAIPAGKEGFISTMMPLAVTASEKTGVDPRIIVAQAAIESGWGKSAPGNNLFGIKSHGQPGGNVLPTTEVVNGQPVRTQDSFAAYASPADSANGYADFINKNPRYAGLKSAQGLDAQVAALGQSGYATDPAYGAKVGSIARGLPGPAPAIIGPNDPSPLDNATYPAGPLAAAQPAAQPPTPVQTVAQAMPQSGVNPKLLAAYASPYVSEGTKKVLGMMLAQQMKPNEYGFQSQPDGTILRTDPRTGNVTPVYQGVTKPTFTKVSTDPNTGQDVMGFVDASGRKVEEYKPPAASAAQPSTLPPVPAGVDPKVWRETFSKNAAANAVPATFDDTSKLRHEFTQLPAYKNMAQAAPVYQAMREAAGRDTKAADLNIVYGLGKIMDPGSVVREGEIAMANNAQGWQEKLNGIIGQINSKGGLTPEGRQALMAEAHGRIQAYNAEYERDTGRYKGIAERNRINTADIIPDFGKIEPWMAPKNAAPIEIDGYQIKAR